MIKDLIQVRKFNRTQQVSFAGGEGIIKSFRFDAGDWVYLVEMPLGAQPNIGKVWAGATVLLNQAELHAM